MSKKKAPAPEAFDKQGPENLPEGFTWCPTCQASYEGEVCPGCVDLSGAGSANPSGAGSGEAPPPDHPAPSEAGGTPLITPETRDAIVAEAALKGLDINHYLVDQTIPLDDMPEEAAQVLLKKLQEATEPGAETNQTDPTTLAEVAERASIETSTITKILPCPLTDAEHKEISKMMAAANQEIVQAEIELKAVKTQYKSRMESAEARRQEYSDIINAGHQQRQVECNLVKDFHHNTITLVRLDTYKIIRTRTMTAAEKQRGLNFEAEE